MTLQQWVEDSGYSASENGDGFVVEIDAECDGEIVDMLHELDDYEVEKEWLSGGGTSYRLVPR